VKEVNKAYKFRFYPNKEQEKVLSQTFGCTRVAYNWCLNLRKEQYTNNGKSINYHESSSLFTTLKKTEEYKWLNEVSCVPLQQSLRHCNTAFLNFFAKRSAFPKFKKKSDKQSIEYTKSAFKFENGKLKLAKMKTALKIKWSRKFEGSPTTVTVSKNPDGKYFVSMLITEKIKPLNPTKNKVGIDLGINDIVVTSDGFKSGNPKNTKRYEERLAKAQKKLSKKTKGSNRYKKQKLKVAKLHAKISNSRNDFLHKLSTDIVRKNQVICTETLVVKNMIKNKKLSKALSDASFGSFLRMLEYKCEWYGRTLVGIDRWYPSSKTCSACGYIHNRLQLRDRTWTCENCNTVLDRDLNASKNILAVGTTVLARGENVSLVSNIS
jgi:putative transposase